MMKNYVLAAFVALAVVGCGDDDQETQIKWNCTGSDCEYSHACAASQSEALGVSRCTATSYGSAKCNPTGDICACPDGAGSCGIVE